MSKGVGKATQEVNSHQERWQGFTKGVGKAIKGAGKDSPRNLARLSPRKTKEGFTKGVGRANKDAGKDSPRELRKAYTKGAGKDLPSPRELRKVSIKGIDQGS